MNKTEMEALLKHMNEDILDWTPHGSAKEIKKWIDGFSMACDMMRNWCQEQIAKRESINENVDAGKKKEEGKLLFEEIPEDIWTDEEMTGKEDKENICRLLGELLAHTRAGANIFTIRYEKNDFGEEFAVIRWNNDSKDLINITADSGIAIIKDVVRHLS